MNAARTEQLTLALRLIMVAALVIGAGTLLWRPSLDAEIPDESAGALAGDSSPGFPGVPAARAGDASRIVGNNLFAPARQPPQHRYNPSAPPSTDAVGLDAGAVSDPLLAAELPSLLGTAIDALGTRALLQMSSSDSSAKFYRVGERIGVYRVQRIEAGRVILSGPSGRVTLELLKPNEVRP